MPTKLHGLGKWLFIVGCLSVSLGFVVAIVRLSRGEGKFFYQAKFTEFFVCQGPDSVTGLPQDRLDSVPSNTETIYACGYLEANGKVPLFFLLFYEGQPTRWLDRETNYRTGYVFKELPQSCRKPGDYRVEVRLQRHLVAATEFTVIP
jgi:hypothetical protein